MPSARPPSASATGRDAVLLRLLYVAGVRVSEAVGLLWVARPRWWEQRGADDPRQRAQDAPRLDHRPAGIRSIGATPPGVGGLPRVRVQDWTRAPSIHPTLRRWSAAPRRTPGSTGRSPRHWLRHAHASAALDRGAPVHLVQAILGHASLTTTSRYVHARPGDGSTRYLAA